jgi:hypothetical protein
MKQVAGISVALLLAMSAYAAEPPSKALRKPANAAVITTPNAAAAAPALRAPLDLRVGHVSKYMMPGVYQMALHSPEPDSNTVVVEGQRVLLPVKSDQPVPGGILAPFWAIAHPTQSWRLLVPDLKRPEDKGPIDPVPPPIFRWGP